MTNKFTVTIALLLVTAKCVFCQPHSKDIIYCHSSHNSGTDERDTIAYVYIDSDTSAICYKRISDTSNVAHTIKEFSEMHLFNFRPISDFASKFPGHWYPVSMLKMGEPFIYAPCLDTCNLTSIAALSYMARGLIQQLTPIFQFLADQAIH
jgi:hypothetical protein